MDYEGHVLTCGAELAPVAMWLHQPSSWQSCCSVVLMMASILSIPREDLSLEELSAAVAVTLPQTQHYSSRCHTPSPLAHAATYSNLHEFRSWWQCFLGFFSNSSFFFSVFTKSLLSATFTLSSQHRSRNCCVTAASLPADRRNLSAPHELREPQ